MNIGQRVRVRRLRDQVPSEVLEKLGKVGTITGFKMVDGSGVGLAVQFDDKLSTWFFEDEVELVKK